MILLLQPLGSNVHLFLFESKEAIREKEPDHSILMTPNGLPLLVEVTKFLAKKKIQLADINVAAVVGSSGTFTTMRLVVSVLNSLVWLHDIAVVQISDLTEGKKGMVRAKKRFLSPQYSGSPNITVSKKSLSTAL